MKMEHGNNQSYDESKDEHSLESLLSTQLQKCKELVHAIQNYDNPTLEIYQYAFDQLAKVLGLPPAKPKPYLPLAKLSRFILSVIFEYLDFSDLVSLMRVSKVFREIATQQKLWMFLCQKHYPTGTNSRPVFAAKPLSQEEDEVDWRKTFEKEYTLEISWRRYKPTEFTLVGHVGPVTCICFDQKRSKIFTGSEDSTAIMWEGVSKDPCAKTNEIFQQHHRQKHPVSKLKTYPGHGGPVWCIDVGEHNIYTGGYDNTIKVWDIATSKCMDTLRGHQNWVSSIAVWDNEGSPEILVSAAWDGLIKVWSLQTKAIKQNMRLAGESPFYTLSANFLEGKLVTGNGDAVISYWDLESGKLMKNITGHAQAVYAVKLEQNDIISGGKECIIKKLDTRTGGLVAEFSGHKSVVTSVAYSKEQHRIVSASNDKTVRIWDTRMPQECLQCLKGHSQAVFCITISDTCIYSGGSDKCIKVWDFSVDNAN